ncbi:hypothetical protein E2C01_072303 [Portunus trituberculatus]|uniref:Uncharacterized protein n=1 Tax=Portunus trituberculatus TaxID=210409 RepID=A0A5B7I6R7_PORTR|nr:hypothetical protein [Portunus trituberculatus]
MVREGIDGGLREGRRQVGSGKGCLKRTQQAQPLTSPLKETSRPAEVPARPHISEANNARGHV